jgi:putative phosphoribosyl transferase
MLCLSEAEMKQHFQAVSVAIPVQQHTIRGDLSVPDNARAAIIFAHGSGSSRHSPRNKYVAETLNQGGFATLLVDLLTAEEEAIDVRSGEYRFNIELLAQRLIAATDWSRQSPQLSSLSLGFFGASTGAAAALVAAAMRPLDIGAIVSRGGRPDLARSYLRKVDTPVLLIVGAFDHDVIELNRRAATMMHAVTEIKIVAGATHLFEEPGALEHVASMAREWFEDKLPIVDRHGKTGSSDGRGVAK